MMRKKYNAWQRIVMAIRNYRDMNNLAQCSLQCPGCGSEVVGDESSWYCPKGCGSGGSG
jgi:hypothetical protein